MSTPRFEEAAPNYGFDSGPPNPWQMVPMNGYKTVKLVNGDGVDLHVVNPGVVSCHPVLGPFRDHALRFSLHGLRKGDTRIQARKSGRVVAQLDISVKLKRTVSVAFNFVRDNAGHRTNRSSSRTDGWVRTMNDIFLPQVNVEITKKTARNVTVPANLGSVVRFSSHLSGVPAAQHEWDDIIATGDSTADLNFFFVWEYEQDATPGTDNTDAGHMSGNVVFEDSAGTEVAETMAHETGHYLGEADYYTTASRPYLMHGYTDVRGRKIPKAHANTMNP